MSDEQRGMLVLLPQLTKTERYASAFQFESSARRQFGGRKHLRQVAARYDGCPKTLLSAITLTSLFMYWLWVLSL